MAIEDIKFPSTEQKKTFQEFLNQLTESLENIKEATKKAMKTSVETDEEKKEKEEGMILLRSIQKKIEDTFKFLSQAPSYDEIKNYVEQKFLEKMSSPKEES